MGADTNPPSTSLLLYETSLLYSGEPTESILILCDFCPEQILFNLSEEAWVWFLVRLGPFYTFSSNIG